MVGYVSSKTVSEIADALCAASGQPLTPKQFRRAVVEAAAALRAALEERPRATDAAVQAGVIACVQAARRGEEAQDQMRCAIEAALAAGAEG